MQRDWLPMEYNPLPYMFIIINCKVGVKLYFLAHYTLFYAVFARKQANMMRLEFQNYRK